MADARDIPGAVTADDAEVRRALEVWDNSTTAERREVASGLFEAVTAYARTKDVDHLVAFADSVGVTVRLRQVPEYVDAARAVPSRPAETVDVHDMLREFGLRE
jgi:hypothetical protein